MCLLYAIDIICHLFSNATFCLTIAGPEMYAFDFYTVQPWLIMPAFLPLPDFLPCIKVSSPSSSSRWTAFLHFPGSFSLAVKILQGGLAGYKIGQEKGTWPWVQLSSTSPISPNPHRPKYCFPPLEAELCTLAGDLPQRQADALCFLA